MKNDAYGDRMKAYEAATRAVLPPHTFTIIRVDGHKFHSFLRGAEKPFDPKVIEAMDHAAITLCSKMTGIRFAYTQSDEISFLLSDLGRQEEPWFGGVVQKMASVAASAVSGAFNEVYTPSTPVTGNYATFDARVYTIPSRVEVMNYFRWRQLDAIRNAVSQAAHANFSHKSLLGVKSEEMQERLFKEKGINFKTEYPHRARRGGVIHRVPRLVVTKEGNPFLRSDFRAKDAPDFVVADESYLADRVPDDGSGPRPSLVTGLLGATLAEVFPDTQSRITLSGVQAELGDDDEQLFRMWLCGKNPFLNDCSPLSYLAAGRTQEVFGAAKAHKDGAFA